MPCVVCGPPGIGKSPPCLQLAIKTIFGLEFIGWETQAMTSYGSSSRARMASAVSRMICLMTAYQVQLAEIENTSLSTRLSPTPTASST